MELLILWPIIGAFIGAIIGGRKGRASAGFVLGFLLGPIGWLVVGFGPDYKQVRDTKKCPFCAELIKREANVCRYCGRDIPAPDPATVSATPEGSKPMGRPPKTFLFLRISVLTVVLVLLAFVVHKCS